MYSIRSFKILNYMYSGALRYKMILFHNHACNSKHLQIMKEMEMLMDRSVPLGGVEAQQNFISKKWPPCDGQMSHYSMKYV